MNELAENRRSQLHRLCESRGWSISQLSRSVGRGTVSFWSDLMRGQKTFGEKLARNVEEGLGLPPLWLDQVRDPPPDRGGLSAQTECLAAAPTDMSEQGAGRDSPLGVNLRRLIEHSGLSLNAFAARHGINQSTLHRVVAGRSDLTVGLLQDWAQKLGCRAEDLLREGFDPMKLDFLLDANSRRLVQAYRTIRSDDDRRLAMALVARLAGLDGKG